MRTKKKKWLRSLTVLLLCAALAVPSAVAAVPGKAEAASQQSGPNLDISEDFEALISILRENHDFWEIIYGSYPWEREEGDWLAKIPGISYSLKTNTLTLKNVNLPTAQLEVRAMGEDFKIKVSGKNKIGGIFAPGSDYASGIKFVGNGSLTVKDDIIVEAGGTNSAVKIGKSVRLKADGISVTDTTASVGIKRDGGGLKIRKGSGEKRTVTEFVIRSEKIDGDYYQCEPKDSSLEGTYVAGRYDTTERGQDFIYKLVPVTGVSGVEYAAVLARDSKGDMLDTDDFTITDTDIEALSTIERIEMDVYKKGGKKYFVNKDYDEKTYTIYEPKAIKDGKTVIGYVAIPVKGQQDLKKIPSGYAKQVEKTGNYFVGKAFSVGP